MAEKWASIELDVRQFVDEVHGTIAALIGSPLDLEVGFYHDLKQVAMPNGTIVFEEEEEQMCAWGDPSTRIDKYSSFVLDLLRVRSPKGLSTFLSDMIAEPDAIRSTIEARANALAFSIVERQYEHFVAVESVERSGDNAVDLSVEEDAEEEVRVRMGGGSGAGFQLYCKDQVILSAGGGSGGGIELRYGYNHTGNSFGGGGGGGANFILGHQGDVGYLDVHVGGGGGGGDALLTFTSFGPDSREFHSRLDGDVNPIEVLRRTKVDFWHRARLCHEAGELFLDGGGGGGGGSQVSATHYCGFGYGFSFHSRNFTRPPRPDELQSDQVNETTVELSDSSSQGEGEGIGTAFKTAASQCNGYKNWQCVCSTGRMLLIQQNVSWADGITCDHGNESFVLNNDSSSSSLNDLPMLINLNARPIAEYATSHHQPTHQTLSIPLVLTTIVVSTFLVVASIRRRTRQRQRRQYQRIP